MNRNMLMELVAVTSFLIVATGIIAWSGADLAVSAPYCLEGKWTIGYLFPWQALYKLDRIPAIGLATVGLAAFVISLFHKNLRQWRRPGAFLVLLLMLGPGLLVNAVFKDHWGRPRPREIVQFGGHKQFLQPWQKGADGNGRSFPSGHGSSAFYMTAPFFIYRRRNRLAARLWLAGGLVFGVFMSIARITQGGHFLSDNLWAWGMIHLSALLLYYCLRLDREPAGSPGTENRPCSS
ncbi:MAG: phosphatase PAP2 family protein [Desulfuromonadales bacterium]|nr:phosphatase PAP2 family protein [Desulfuromonadales bacterium]